MHFTRSFNELMRTLVDRGRGWLCVSVQYHIHGVVLRSEEPSGAGLSDIAHCSRLHSPGGIGETLEEAPCLPHDTGWHSRCAVHVSGLGFCFAWLLSFLMRGVSQLVDREDGQREVTAKEGASVAFKFKCPFIEVSARSGEGVLECFDTLVTEVRKHKLWQLKVQQAGGGGSKSTPAEPTPSIPTAPPPPPAAIGEGSLERWSSKSKKWKRAHYMVQGGRLLEYEVKNGSKLEEFTLHRVQVTEYEPEKTQNTLRIAWPNQTIELILKVLSIICTSVTCAYFELILKVLFPLSVLWSLVLT